MLKVLSNLFGCKTSDENAKLSTSEKPVESENQTVKQEVQKIVEKRFLEILEEVTVKKSVEERFLEMLKETINSIELDLKNNNPSSSSDLLQLCKSVLHSKQFSQLTALGTVHKDVFLLDKDFFRIVKKRVVGGELNGKEHAWIVVGVYRDSYLYCDFIYKPYEKEDIKWIIDLQPILDDVNNHIAILDYNEHPEYIPYGNKTISNVEEYFKSKSNLKDVIIYQKPEYFTEMSGELTKIHNGYYFDADVLLFLLDSDFVAYPHRYVNNTNKELFEKIQKNTNQLMEAIESEDSFDVKSHIVSLFEENEKLDLIPKHYQVMLVGC